MDFWQRLFLGKTDIWGMEPADTAIHAAELFRASGFKNILLPGCGYGRNAGPFLDAGMSLTGIEIAEAAIQQAREHGFTFPIYHASVTDMPLDEQLYDAVYCYALVHLLNRTERRRFISSCFTRLKKGGMMVFVTGSTEVELYGKGRRLSHNRFEIEKGLRSYFYDREAMVREFTPFGLKELYRFDEPMKFLKEKLTMPMWVACCKK